MDLTNALPQDNQIDTHSPQYDEFSLARQARDLLFEDFRGIDKNRNGAVSKSELALFHPASDYDQKSVDYLSTHYDSIVASPLPQLSYGITRDDMNRYLMKRDPDFLNKGHELELLSTVFDQNLTKFDLNKDKFLNQSELALAAADPSIDVGAKYMVDFLSRGYSTISQLDPLDESGLYKGAAVPGYGQGISKDDMKELDTEFAYEKAERAIQLRSLEWSAGMGATLSVVAVLGGPTTLPEFAILAGAGFVGGYVIEQLRDRETFERNREQIWQVLDSLDGVAGPNIGIEQTTANKP